MDVLQHYTSCQVWTLEIYDDGMIRINYYCKSMHSKNLILNMTPARTGGILLPKRLLCKQHSNSDDKPKNKWGDLQN